MGFLYWLESIEGIFSDNDFATGEFTRHITKKIGTATLVFDIQGDTISLSSVRVSQTNRGKGAARNALVSLLAEADKRKLKVKLLASPLDRRTNLRKLVQFYKNVGFVVIGIGNPAGDPIMIRQPK